MNDASKFLRFPDETMDLIDELFFYFFGLYPNSRKLFENPEHLANTKLCWAKGFQFWNIIEKDGYFFEPILRSGIDALFLVHAEIMPGFKQFVDLCWGEEELLDEIKEDKKKRKKYVEEKYENKRK